MLGKQNGKFQPKRVIKYSPTVFGAKMPILEVNLKNIPQAVQALADTGSTNSLLNIRVANRLELEVEEDKVEYGTGAGGVYEYVPMHEPVEIEILGEKYNINFDIPLDEQFAWPIILGHNSLFKFSKVVFKTYREEFEVFLKTRN